MSTFLNGEKTLQENFKKNSPHISAPAKAQGMYRGVLRDFCLPVSHSDENLFPGIRTQGINFFKQNSIAWHQGHRDKPNNHMCSSQVCCVNFLFPFALASKECLVELLRPVYPTIKDIVSMDNLNLTFEWIGQTNYLREKMRGARTRGANATSADAAIRFLHSDGKVQIVLIEWKYTESYGHKSIKVSESGTDRSDIYRNLFEDSSCPLNKSLFSYDDLFYEPFYQLFRQQLLANEMEKSGELDADIVSVLHINPAVNKAFQKVTSPGLQKLGNEVTYVWNKLQNRTDRFCSVSTEYLFGNFPVDQFAGLEPWWEYISSRYRGILGK